MNESDFNPKERLIKSQFLIPLAFPNLKLVNLLGKSFKLCYGNRQLCSSRLSKFGRNDFKSRKDIFTRQEKFKLRVLKFDGRELSCTKAKDDSIPFKFKYFNVEGNLEKT